MRPGQSQMASRTERDRRARSRSCRTDRRLIVCCRTMTVRRGAGQQVEYQIDRLAVPPPPRKREQQSENQYASRSRSGSLRDPGPYVTREERSTRAAVVNADSETAAAHRVPLVSGITV